MGGNPPVFERGDVERETVMNDATSLVPPRRRASLSLAALAAAALAIGIGGAAAFAQDAAPAPAAEEAAPVTVGANINISPKRLTFDRSGRSATVYIFNQGTTRSTFDINLVDRVMLPTGEIMPVEEAAANPQYAALVGQLSSAKPLLLATPRRATLDPGKGQTIRVRVNPSAETTVPPGEYRSHLTVSTVPPRSVGLTAEQASKPRPDELSFTVVSVFGISIPVIVRLGAADFRAGIQNSTLSYSDISMDGKSPPARTPVLNFDVTRLGASSLFGNIEVRSPKAKEPIGIARGVGVYREVDRRAVHIPLTRAVASGEQLEITFNDDDTSPGRVLARSAFTAP